MKNIFKILLPFLMLLMSCTPESEQKTLRIVDESVFRNVVGDATTVDFVVEWNGVVWVIEEVPGEDGALLDELKPASHVGTLDSKGYTNGSFKIGRNETGKVRSTSLVLKSTAGFEPSKEVVVTVTQQKYKKQE